MGNRRLACIVAAAAVSAALLASREASAVMIPSINRESWTKDSSAFVLTTGFESDDVEELHVYAAADGKEIPLADEKAFDAFVEKHPLVADDDPPGAGDDLEATTDVDEKRRYKKGQS